MKILSVLVVAAAMGGCGDDLDTDLPDLQGPLVDSPAPGLHGASGRASRPHPLCRPTALTSPWYGTNRETLTTWIDSLGCESEGYQINHKPVALFDWDNTVLKNDVGDAITFYLITNDKVLQPPGQDWKATSRYMTDAAATALTAACGTSVPAGSPLPTSTNLDCADEMLSMYVDGKTRSNLPAFEGHNFRRMEPTYAWTVQLLAGYTHAQVEQMALAAILPKLSAPIGTTQVVGTRTLNGWVRIYDQMKELIRALQTRGYDVWVITASPQDVVAAIAPYAGIPANKVVGVRSLTDSAGRLTYDFEGCGPVPDGDNSMMSYIEGKRCWVNKVVYHDNTANAINRRPEGSRQVIGLGDSDTDVEFMRDATFKVMLNRNKREAMCFSYHNEDGNWLVNPMFIEPRPAQTSLYPCSTTACKDAAGTGRACVDEGNDVIPDQVDSVHP